jgi:hypothetical protein
MNDYALCALQSCPDGGTYTPPAALRLWNTGTEEVWIPGQTQTNPAGKSVVWVTLPEFCCRAVFPVLHQSSIPSFHSQSGRLRSTRAHLYVLEKESLIK